MEYWKKSLSYFFNTTQKWNEVAQTGNPTQSKKVNTLIKVVKRAETRGNGAQAKADRALSISEFKALLDLMESNQYRAAMNFQHHLIGRCDDMAHVKKSTLKPSLEFPGYLTTKIAWSKNVHDESNCPDQILIPCMDHEMCCYLSLAIWLEKWIQFGDGWLSQWLFCDGSTTSDSPTIDQDREALNGKNSYTRAIKRALENPAFRKESPGKLGSHSIRKLAVTTCRRKGVKKDDIDYRARWQTNGRMQDRYTDIQLNWPDVHCAGKLCNDRPCKYVVKESAGITDEWLCRNVVPNITAVFGNEVGAIFAKPLLWAAYDVEWSERLSPEIKHRIISAFIRLDRGVDVGNPVKIVEIIAMEGRNNAVLLADKWANAIYNLTVSYLPVTVYRS